MRIMDTAFDRLADIQKQNINRRMFAIAYLCVVQSKGDPDVLMSLILRQTESCPHLTPDLIRYCRLADSVK